MFPATLLGHKSMNESTIFNQALEISDPTARAEFLDQACQDDDQLRRQIEQLLAAHTDPDSYFEAPFHRTDGPQEGPTSDWPHAGLEQPGQKIGPYKLLQQIGEGGMGIVYMAEQVEPVQRRVALKIIKPGMDSRQVIARFEAERQALAMMDHPNIAKVLDAGTTSSGRPFFVMELVHGVPITEYCDHNTLSPRDRLALFISVCRGVQHAHQKGIIHRDIKPTNILVAEYDERPVPKIIDFGVAKATAAKLTDRTLFTEFGQIVGTLEYMSPEQAKRNQLDVDTRSDIYSLGIVLYTLLTGEPPFAKDRFSNAAWDEMLRVIREEEPVRPSVKLSGSQTIDEIAGQRNVEPKRLAALVRGDLDWIVMKALEKDRAKRYASANEFAEDIGRHLAQQPIVARPPSTADRFAKFARRNSKALITTAALVAGVFIAAIWTARVMQQTRQVTADRSAQVSAALQEASLALGLAVASPIGRESEWFNAASAARRIDDLLANGEVEPDIAPRATAFAENFQHAREDRELAEQIEQVVIAGATNPDLESWERMERDFRTLFLKSGFDLENGDPAEIAQRIRDHRASKNWVDALELWIGTRAQMGMLGGPPTTAAMMQPWADAMYLADNHPVRTAVRRFIYEQKTDGALLDEAVAGVDLAEMTPRGLAWLAGAYFTAGEPDKCDEVFEIAVREYPSDLMLNFDIAFTLYYMGRWQKSIRYYHRCLALRPDVPGLWKSLSLALEKADEKEAARAAMERSKELSVAQS